MWLFHDTSKKTHSLLGKALSNHSTLLIILIISDCPPPPLHSCLLLSASLVKYIRVLIIVFFSDFILCLSFSSYASLPLSFLFFILLFLPCSPFCFPSHSIFPSCHYYLLCFHSHFCSIWYIILSDDFLWYWL